MMIKALLFIAYLATPATEPVVEQPQDTVVSEDGTLAGKKTKQVVQPGPDHVFRIERQTFPHLYKLGLNLTLSYKVINFTLGGESG